MFGRRKSLLMLFVGLTGCGMSQVSSAVMPGVQLASYKRAYVACHPGDEANVCGLIAAQLVRLGFDAVAGPGEADTARNVEVLVTYEDRWTWDVTMYLITLRIDMRDPRTNVLLATTHVYHPSVERRNPEAVVREALYSLLPPRG